MKFAQRSVIAALLLCAPACTRPSGTAPSSPSRQNTPASNDEGPAATLDVDHELDSGAAARSDASARVGMTEPELIAYYADAAADHAFVESTRLEADREFSSAEPVDVVRSSFRIVLPDEVSAIDTERALRIDEQGDRATAMLIGTGLPAVPGTRIAARNGYAGLALCSPDGSRYRAATTDEVQHWFLGTSSRAGTTLAFHRTDSTVLATRGGLSLLLSAPAEGDRRPLTCRMFVAMILGGDPAVARIGCANARLPTRVLVRARGWPSITFERTTSTPVQLPRRALALPPPDATPDYTPPPHPTDGAFFAPTELAALPGRHDARFTLSATNALTREALVFYDDLAIGWLAPGATATFVGLSGGPIGAPHHVRARSLDGLERSSTVPATLPMAVTFELDPHLR